MNDSLHANRGGERHRAVAERLLDFSDLSASAGAAGGAISSDIRCAEHLLTLNHRSVDRRSVVAQRVPWDHAETYALRAIEMLRGIDHASGPASAALMTMLFNRAQPEERRRPAFDALQSTDPSTARFAGALMCLGADFSREQFLEGMACLERLDPHLARSLVLRALDEGQNTFKVTHGLGELIVSAPGTAFAMAHHLAATSPNPEIRVHAAEVMDELADTFKSVELPASAMPHVSPRPPEDLVSLGLHVLDEHDAHQLSQTLARMADIGNGTGRRAALGLATALAANLLDKSHNGALTFLAANEPALYQVLSDLG